MTIISKSRKPFRVNIAFFFNLAKNIVKILLYPLKNEAKNYHKNNSQGFRGFLPQFQKLYQRLVTKLVKKTKDKIQAYAIFYNYESQWSMQLNYVIRENKGISEV